MLTPFARGLLGWTTRVPLWFFCANRPRAGKDYLAAITLLIYEGIAFEDMPLGKDAEETCKRIISAARNGRRFMHFSNCQFYLQDQYLAQVVTNPMISGRSLGANSAQSDLQIPNEMEFSLSGNVGLSYREDFDEPASENRTGLLRGRFQLPRVQEPAAAPEHPEKPRDGPLGHRRHLPKLGGPGNAPLVPSSFKSFP